MKKAFLIMKTVIIIIIVALTFAGCVGLATNLSNGSNTGDVDEVEEVVDFSSMSYLSFGDSITYGSNLFDSSTYRWTTPYPTAVANELKFNTVENKGRAGATLSSNTLGLSCIADIIQTSSGDYDIISLLGGVNDFNRDLPIGTLTDTTSDTIYGSLDVIAKCLTSNYPNAFIFFMTPLKFVYNDYNFYTPNNAGYMIEDVCIAVKLVAKRYNIPVLDLYNDSNFQNHLYDTNCDGLHPNQDFILESLAPQIADFIKDNYNK